MFDACKLVSARVRFAKYFYTSFYSQTFDYMTKSCTNRLEKQAISVANSIYERSKEESVLIEAYKSGTLFVSRQSLPQVCASLTYTLCMFNKDLT